MLLGRRELTFHRVLVSEVQVSLGEIGLCFERLDEILLGFTALPLAKQKRSQVKRRQAVTRVYFQSRSVGRGRRAVLALQGKERAEFIMRLRDPGIQP